MDVYDERAIAQQGPPYKERIIQQFAVGYAGFRARAMRRAEN